MNVPVCVVWCVYMCVLWLLLVSFFFFYCFVSICNDTRGKDLLGDLPLPRDEQTEEVGGICIWEDMISFLF